MTAGLVAHRAAQPIVILLETFCLIRDAAAAQIRHASDHNPRGFAFGVGIDDAEIVLAHGRSFL